MKIKTSNMQLLSKVVKPNFQLSTLNSQLILIVVFFLLSCAPSFTNSHKLYSGLPAKSESVGYVELGDGFMLTRADWFTEKLNIPNDSIYSKLEKLTDSVISNELQKNWNISTVSKNDTFLRETLKMDNTIFIKTKFPEQGVEIAANNGSVPNYLFIIHEYTIGGDLEAENFYDYRKANLETVQKKKFKKLSIIATFTLWDNKKQLPLKSGIISVQKPIKNDSIDRDFFINSTKAVVEECLKML
ncbi:MAG: hypothetical protein FWC15_08440 [Fibromonadales bacterium]|nr:hypothetical protein [Fibromonadales bacterium]MCL2261362.1 hypothetical protein [Fibromonadales bacterium]